MPEARSKTREREDELIRATDVELVAQTYAVLDHGEVGEAERDDLYFLLQEAFERWAPEAEWADRERRHREADHGDGLAEELLASWDAMRRREGGRLLHREFGGRDDA